ncbi:MAG: DUF4105 domain-containing protein [Alphaproteobacteria bacterium]|nr:DUF4105 domain-containing protein [Alphaproteobacteria bacterium]
MKTMKKQLVRGLLFLVCVCTIHTAYAKTKYDIPPLTEDLRKQWLTLNHYKHTWRGNYQNEINNEDYFLAVTGQIDPYEEYLAFVNVLQRYRTDKNKEDAATICRFPARTTLLIPHLKWFKKKHRPKCKEFNKLNNLKKIKSISLLFASGYFDSPSSYFGHALLKFNYTDDVLNQKALDASLNYGADVTDSEGSPFYILNGLTGGYQANYKRNNNFIHSHHYTNTQIRDLWEYKLSLTPAQIRYIVEHSWELRNAQFSYYFLNDNCAHRIIKLVEMATGKNLSKTHGFWLLPVQLTQHLQQQGLIGEETYIPSLKTTFTEKYRQLSKEEQKQFIRFFDETPQIQEAYAQTLSAKLLFLILNQLDLQVAKLTISKKDEEALNNLNRQRAVILGAMLKRPAAQLERPSFKKKEGTTLLNNKPSSVIQAGTIHRKKTTGALLRYQIANNDLLTQRLPGQEISRFIMGAAEVEVQKGNISPHKVTLIDIANINTNPLPSRLTKEYSWSINIDYTARNLTCTKCKTFGIESKLGKAARLNDSLAVYGLTGGRLHHKRTDHHRYVSLEAETGGVWDINTTTKLKAGVDISVDPIKGNPEYLTHGTLALDITKNKDIRLHIENNGHTTAATALLGLYFN